MNLAYCLFTPFTEAGTQPQVADKDQMSCTTNQRIFADDVIRFVRRSDMIYLPNPFEISDKFFRRCFRLDKTLFQDFLLIICLRTYYRPQLDMHRIPFDLRVLATLGYLAHGHLEYVMQLDAFKLYSRTMLMRCVPQVCQLVVYFMAPDMVAFPVNDVDLVSRKQGFATQFDVPGVVGVLDCFHVRLGKVNEEFREVYTCRHGDLAVNVQVICDHNMRFLNVNPYCAGSASDIYVWNHSHVRGIMKHLTEKDRWTWLVGDRGYNLETMLINPYRNASTKVECQVNTALENVLGVLDNAISILKARFKCLNSVLPYTHQHAANIITTCVALHNYMLAKGCAIEENIQFDVPKRKQLPNAKNEDEWSNGYNNREIIKARLSLND